MINPKPRKVLRKKGKSLFIYCTTVRNTHLKYIQNIIIWFDIILYVVRLYVPYNLDSLKSTHTDSRTKIWSDFN